jgi:tetratricopeptide (TPR) repeat protein
MRTAARVFALCCWALAGCVSAPPPASLPPAPPPGHAWDAALAAFERREREAAEDAARAGRFADSLWAWDALLAVAPDDGAAVARRAAVQASAEGAAASALARARDARRRGDVEAAVHAYLEVLAITPDAEAADAVRDIERRRTAGGNAKAGRSPAAATSLARGASAADSSELEQAAMLAAQDEVDAAIALLEPLADADAAARRMLADLYVRRAVRLQGTDRAGALAAVRRALVLVPGHAGAAARLRALSVSSGPASASSPAPSSTPAGRPRPQGRVPAPSASS